jgi:hypothetical protein
LQLARYWYQLAAQNRDEAAPDKLREIDARLAARKRSQRLPSAGGVVLASTFIDHQTAVSQFSDENALRIGAHGIGRCSGYTTE